MEVSIERSSSGDLPKKLGGSSAFDLIAEEDRFLHLQHLLKKFIKTEKMKQQQEMNNRQSVSTKTIQSIHSPWWIQQPQGEKQQKVLIKGYGSQRRSISLNSLNSLPDDSSDKKREQQPLRFQPQPYSPHDFYIRGRSSHHHKLPGNVFLFYQQPQPVVVQQQQFNPILAKAAPEVKPSTPVKEKKVKKTTKKSKEPAPISNIDENSLLMQLTDDQKVQYILENQSQRKPQGKIMGYDNKNMTRSDESEIAVKQNNKTKSTKTKRKSDDSLSESQKEGNQSRVKTTSKSKENEFQFPALSYKTNNNNSVNNYGSLTQQRRSLSCESLLNNKNLIDFKSYEGPQSIDYSSPFDFAKTRFINNFILSGQKIEDPFKVTPTQTLVTEAKNKFEKTSLPLTGIPSLSQTECLDLRSPGFAPRVRQTSTSSSSSSSPQNQSPGRAPGRNPVKPFLSRGSVAERVLLFEKCPEIRAERRSLNFSDVRTKDSRSSILYHHWRNGTVNGNKINQPSSASDSILRSSKGALLRRVFAKTASTAGLEIPRFYFPHGRPYTSLEIEQRIYKIKAEFDKLPGKFVASKLDMGRITKACGLPLSWKEPLRQAVMSFSGTQTDKKNPEPKEFPRINCEDFLDFWKKTLSTSYDEASRFVKILTKGKRNYIVSDDFIPMIQDVVECHPGLTFLKEASEFHSRYVHTVIARIFYCVNRSWSGKITASELRKSNFLAVVSLLDEEEDINQITEYFSYEHFYVIYCKFWELDKDHDLIIDKHDLSKHNDGAISIRMIDRIFSGAVTRGPVVKYGKMTYTEFVWFLISEEDKHHPRAIEYWFRCMDLDGDGFLSMYELEWFYSEQARRLEAMGIEALPFNDTLCQMLDMIRPKYRDRISLADLKRCKMTPIFFDTFFNLEKYLDHEQKDPFASNKTDEEVSDWDRFAAEEYEILVAEESSGTGHHQQQQQSIGNTSVASTKN